MDGTRAKSLEEITMNVRKRKEETMNKRMVRYP